MWWGAALCLVCCALAFFLSQRRVHEPRHAEVASGLRLIGKHSVVEHNPVVLCDCYRLYAKGKRANPVRCNRSVGANSITPVAEE